VPYRVVSGRRAARLGKVPYGPSSPNASVSSSWPKGTSPRLGKAGWAGDTERQMGSEVRPKGAEWCAADLADPAHRLLVQCVQIGPANHLKPEVHPALGR
jgi:hypothetical protein